MGHKIINTNSQLIFMRNMTEIFTKYVYLTLLSIDLLLKFNLKIR